MDFHVFSLLNDNFFLLPFLETRAMTRDGESNDTLVHTFGGTGSLTASGIFSNDTRHNLSNIPLKPHEKRAINFLVHEFLLQNEHKLTSVTFSDEVDDQVSFAILFIASVSAD